MRARSGARRRRTPADVLGRGGRMRDAGSGGGAGGGIPATAASLRRGRGVLRLAPRNTATRREGTAHKLQPTSLSLATDSQLLAVAAPRHGVVMRTRAPILRRSCSPCSSPGWGSEAFAPGAGLAPSRNSTDAQRPSAYHVPLGTPSGVRAKLGDAARRLQPAVPRAHHVHGAVPIMEDPVNQIIARHALPRLGGGEAAQVHQLAGRLGDRRLRAVRHDEPRQVRDLDDQRRRLWARALAARRKRSRRRTADAMVHRLRWRRGLPGDPARLDINVRAPR